MATIYYPSNASVYTRQVNGNLTEQILGLTPDTIFVFSTASLGFTASLTSSGTSSWASSSISSSYANYADSASVAISASYAPSSGGGATLATGSTYPITASWAISASWAPSSGGGTTLTTGSTYPITASWSQTSSLALSSSAIYLSASATNSPLSIVFATNSGSGQTLLVDASNGITYNSSTDVFVVTNISASQITASFTGSLTGIATSASYALSASYAPSSGGGGGLTTGSTYQITSSWAVNAISANSVGTATYAQNLYPVSSQDILIYNGSAYSGFIKNSGCACSYTNAIGANAGVGANNNYNCFYGSYAGWNSYYLGDAVCVGNNAGSNMGAGASTGLICIGSYTAYGAQGNCNGGICIGYQAGHSNSELMNAIMIGQDAGHNTTNSKRNCIFIGYQAGFYDSVNTSDGSTAILIGVSTSTGTYKNGIAIGCGVSNTANNQLNIGNILYGSNVYSGSTTGVPQTNAKIGIGISAITNSLDVSGNISCSVVTASLFYGTASLANSLTPNAQPYVTIATSSLNWITCSFADVEEVVNITTGLAYNFTHSNMPPANNIGNVSVLLRNTAAASSSLSFPAFWTFIGSAPVSLQAGKSAMLSLKAYDTSSVIAAFGVQY